MDKGCNGNWILPISIFPSEMFSYHEEGAGKISCVFLSSFLSGMALQCSQERAALRAGSRKVSATCQLELAENIANTQHWKHFCWQQLLITVFILSSHCSSLLKWVPTVTATAGRTETPMFCRSSLFISRLSSKLCLAPDWQKPKWPREV